MKNNNLFKVGQRVTVDGKDGEFRYISKNIVKSIKNGQCLSVSPKSIKPKYTLFQKIINIFNSEIK
jgi:hypothetical protein